MDNELERKKSNRTLFWTLLFMTITVAAVLSEHIIRIAADAERLKFTLEKAMRGYNTAIKENDIKIIGHAIECRINAEDYDN